MGLFRMQNGIDTLERIDKAALMSYYEFDETSGTVMYDKVDGLDGARNGALLGGTLIGDCYDYVGSTSAPTINVTSGSKMNIDPFTDPYSISFWFNIENGTQKVVELVAWFNTAATDVPFRIFYTFANSAPKLTMILSDSAYNMEIVDYNLTNSSHMATITIDNNNSISRLYIDGIVVVGSIIPFQRSVDTVGIIQLGGMTSIVTGRELEGNIDELLFMNGILTQSQITRLYNKGRGRTYDTI